MLYHSQTIRLDTCGESFMPLRMTSYNLTPEENLRGILGGTESDWKFAKECGVDDSAAASWDCLR